ncbi:dihydropteroate synthase [Streptomyces sp. NPDC020681]|uniref:dihydropteroate synthase n=1 Tax=Streptomyces sp. NPDC020681 TaxID=3365083 RepID=UPI00379D2CBB
MTSIMGVLNVTPDSFSDGGNYPDLTAVLAHAHEMLAEGADIVDVGGESTRPGATPVSVAEELRRTVPIVEALAAHCTVSIDTTKERVATACVRAGASIINDVSSCLDGVAADLGAGWIAMHMQGVPLTMQAQPRYGDVVAEVRDHLVATADRALSRGVAKVWIDPGIGFGKGFEHNLELLRHIDELISTGHPVAVGLSRKSFIGTLTDQPVPHKRVTGSAVAAALAAGAGVDLVRVHDVRETVEALRVAAALSTIRVVGSQ